VSFGGCLMVVFACCFLVAGLNVVVASVNLYGTVFVNQILDRIQISDKD
jgi:hypothetical protein